MKASKLTKTDVEEPFWALGRKEKKFQTYLSHNSWISWEI